MHALDRDCNPLGQIEVKVTSPPDHGTVHVTSGLNFSEHRPGDPPYFCDARRTPATIVTYQAAPAYTGSDVSVFQIFFPDGRAPTVRTDITVD